MNHAGFLETAVRIAREASVRMGYMFAMPAHQLEIKAKEEDAKTPVSLIDREVSKLMIGQLREAFPKHAFTDEEAGSSGASSYRWWSDPFDGTSNIDPKFRLSTVGLALEYEGQVVVAAAADPFENTVTYAERGKGAFVARYQDDALEPRGEPRRIHVSGDRPREKRFAEVDGLWNDQTSGRKSHFLRALSKHTQNIRMFGSNILSASHVAQGRIDIWLMDAVGGHWDTAPGILLIEEAGGKVTDFNGNSPKAGGYHGVLGTNGDLHDQILNLVRHSYHEYEGFRPKK